MARQGLGIGGMANHRQHKEWDKKAKRKDWHGREGTENKDKILKKTDRG